MNVLKPHVVLAKVSQTLPVGPLHLLHRMFLGDGHHPGGDGPAHLYHNMGYAMNAGSHVEWQNNGLV